MSQLKVELQFLTTSLLHVVRGVIEFPAKLKLKSSANQVVSFRDSNAENLGASIKR